MERKEAVYAAEEKKQAIIEWIVGIIAGLVSASILFVIFYFIGVSQGKW